MGRPILLTITNFYNHLSWTVQQPRKKIFQVISWVLSERKSHFSTAVSAQRFIRLYTHDNDPTYLTIFNQISIKYSVCEHVTLYFFILAEMAEDNINLQHCHPLLLFLQLFLLF